MTTSDITAYVPEAPNEPPAKSPASQKDPLWGAFAKAGATLVAIVAAELSLIGHVSWSKWLDHWGFDHGEMPLDATGRVIQGYVAVMDRCGALFSSWTGTILGTVFTLTGLYVSILLTARSIAKRRGRGGPTLSARLQQAPRWVKDIAIAFSISGLGVAVVYFLLVGSFVVLFLGPAIGVGAAKSWAKHTENEIQKGCPRAGHHGVCTQVIRDGKIVASGLTLASSTARIAIYDMDSKHPQMLRLDGADLVGWN